MGTYPNDQGQAAGAIPVWSAPPPSSSVRTAPSSTATVTQVAATATAGGVVALAANTPRVGAMFFNSGSAGIVYLLYGAGTVSATNCSVVIQPGGFFNMPVVYNDEIQAIWSTVTGAGNLLVTELTP